ncbi:MAG TPA: hypothetical protein VFR24_12075 [Candidatus Angelobacter sp.]|nr:hypothetical protein [Candidatus Angelobacter sp.]
MKTYIHHLYTGSEPWMVWGLGGFFTAGNQSQHEDGYQEPDAST